MEKKKMIIWIVVGLLVLVGIILIWRAMAKSNQDKQDAEEARRDAADTSMPESKKQCRKYCRQTCKEKYKGKARRDCKKKCKQDCFDNVRVADINY